MTAAIATDSAGHRYRLEEIACPICARTDPKVIGTRGGTSQREGLGIATEIVRCRGCGLLYPRPFPFPFDSDELYDDPQSYFEHHDEEGKVQEYRELLRGLIERRGGAASSFLDVGCGRGEALEAARLEGIDDAVGLEFASAMASYAREHHGAEVVEGAIQEYDPGRTFDVVLLGAVIEHVHDPASFMAAVARLMEPGDVLFLDTPREPNVLTGIGNLLNRVRGRREVFNLAPTWTPYHVFGFNPKSIRALLDAHGFEVERIVLKHGNPLVPPGPGLRGKVTAAVGTNLIRLGNLTPWASNMAVWARRR